jgi:hypothetical protein
LIALLIIIALLPFAWGNSVSLAGGRTISISGNGAVKGTITLNGYENALPRATLPGAAFDIPPGTNTISLVIPNAANGDNLFLEAGTYFDNAVIDKSLSITGKGPGQTTVDGQKKGSVFTINNPSAVVTLADMRIQNGVGTPDIYGTYGGGIYNTGTLNLDNLLITGNTADLGAGIFNYGTVNMDARSSIASNTAGYGGGIYNYFYGAVNMNLGSSIYRNTAGYGGGIYNEGWLYMTSDSSIYGNTANSQGGGIYNYGTVDMDASSSIYGNTAYYQGGGIYNYFYGTVNMNQESSIYSNTALSQGGGIENEGGTVNMDGSSSIYGNKAISQGGGILNYGTVTMYGASIDSNAAGYGGGIYNYGIANMYEGHSTISQNIADTDGGGIYNNGGTLKAFNIQGQQIPVDTQQQVFDNHLYSITGPIDNISP